MTRIPGSILLVILALSVMLGSLTFSGPATQNNYSILAIRGDTFYNWDHAKKSASYSNADWPLTILFWGYASESKIKNNYFRLWSPLALNRHAYMDDGNGWFWDSDVGRKAHYEFNPPLVINCDGVTVNVQDVFVHVRFYAKDGNSNYNPAWGYYVLASTHLDDWPDEDWAGFATEARTLVAVYLRSKGLSVIDPWAYFYNEDTTCRIGSGGRHFNLHDGWAMAVYIPP
ncbi:MAG: hypothetical protein GSR78_00035 [Desulfurococcales archaeon]|nr:hypothetical protein [Desulfurococcales archaeon]